MGCGIYIVHGELHMYVDTTHIKTWDTAVGEELLCKGEPNNLWDSYTFAVIKDDCVVEVL